MAFGPTSARDLDPAGRADLRQLRQAFSLIAVETWGPDRGRN